MPIAQASGENSNPRPRSRLSGAPATGPARPSRPSTIATKATNTTREAPTASTICSPSLVPRMRASMELS